MPSFGVLFPISPWARPTRRAWVNHVIEELRVASSVASSKRSRCVSRLMG